MNQKKLEYWLWLNTLNGIGPSTIRKLLAALGSPECVYEAEKDALMRNAGIRPAAAELIIQEKAMDTAEKILEDCQKKGVSIVTLDEAGFPSRLRQIDDAPVLLFYKGTLKETEHTAGIVGSRKCSRDGRAKAIQLSEALAAEGRTIVSGMAIGADTYAHTAALKKGCYTIAVLGCGADICYPKAHIDIYDALSKKGLILSEYPPGTPPLTWQFPKRNRIIAGLSDELYVIDPGRNSGSLITAACAKKYQKPVQIIRPD